MIDMHRVLVCGAAFVGLTVVVEIARWVAAWVALLGARGAGRGR